MNLKENIKKALDEELGVPKNIVNVGNQVYDEIMNELDDDEEISTSEDYETTLYSKDGFTISDLTFHYVSFSIESIPHKEYDIAGMATSDASKVTKKFKVKTKFNKDNFNIKFILAIPENDEVKGSDIKNFLNNNKPKVVSSIVHELKHYYDSFKKRKGNLKDRVNYEVFSSNKFANIIPLNEFLHNSYFIHSIENLVRPSEIASLIDTGKITKKEFYKFLMDNETYKKLKKIESFTDEGLRSELKQDIENIKFIFKENQIPFKNMNDDEIIDKCLELFMTNIVNWKGMSMNRRLASNFLEALLGFSGKKAEYFNDYIKEVNKFGDNFKKYFEYEEKYSKFVANKMIRKIAKLFAMSKDIKNESINNRELWLKALGVQSYILKESMYKKKSSK